jgi:EAL domain-containing protein (putative c-di-GMP-specific phosphodiesterase class I)/CheY-like chemotaxis protein
MSRPVRLLVVDDSQADAVLAMKALARGGFAVQYELVDRLEAVQAALQAGAWDAIVSDFSLPGFTGLQVLEVLRSTGFDIPFILISGAIGEETAVDAMKAGASDYLMKDRLERLAPALERALQEAELRARHRRALEELEESQAQLRRLTRVHAQRSGKRTGEKVALHSELRSALENEQFVLHYQPKVDLGSRRIVGVEALLRWQSPVRGLVPPLQFIGLLEESGLILEVGAWALRQAALDQAGWSERQLKPPRVAVNVSPAQLRQRDFVAVVQEAVAAGPAPVAIDLEITESLIMEDIQGNIDKLKAVRDLGMDIAIDDFGTGYSSLAYLARLPVATLKIDRSFIVDFTDPNVTSLVSTIISLGRSLNLKIVAEGVETEDQAKLLWLLRCDQAQGYLFGRPEPFDAMCEVLAGKNGLAEQT